MDHTVKIMDLKLMFVWFNIVKEFIESFLKKFVSCFLISFSFVALLENRYESLQSASFMNWSVSQWFYELHAKIQRKEALWQLA